MGLFGNLLGSVLGGGSKPKVPAWNNIDLGAEQQKAITANAAALPGAEALVSAANQFSQDQITKMLEQAIPGYSNIVGTTSQNIESELKGEIPTDVSQAVQSSAAARALGGGYAGTGMGRNLVARDLGLTSLDLTSKGLSSAESWMTTMNNLFRPSMIDVSSMFISPQQMFQADFQNQESAWNVNWLKNQVKAMPDPFGEALGQFLGGIGDAAASYFGGAGVAQVASGGGSGGGGGGGMNMMSFGKSSTGGGDMGGAGMANMVSMNSMMGM